jgi:hypothetical protein
LCHVKQVGAALAKVDAALAELAAHFPSAPTAPLPPSAASAATPRSGPPAAPFASEAAQAAAAAVGQQLGSGQWAVGQQLGREGGGAGGESAVEAFEAVGTPLGTPVKLADGFPASPDPATPIYAPAPAAAAVAPALGRDTVVRAVSLGLPMSSVALGSPTVTNAAGAVTAATGVPADREGEDARAPRARAVSGGGSLVAALAAAAAPYGRLDIVQGTPAEEGGGTEIQPVTSVPSLAAVAAASMAAAAASEPVEGLPRGPAVSLGVPLGSVAMGSPVAATAAVDDVEGAPSPLEPGGPSLGLPVGSVVLGSPAPPAPPAPPAAAAARAPAPAPTAPPPPAAAPLASRLPSYGVASLDSLLLAEVDKLKRVNRALAGTLASYTRVTDTLSGAVTNETVTNSATVAPTVGLSSTSPAGRAPYAPAVQPSYTSSPTVGLSSYLAPYGGPSTYARVPASTAYGGAAAGSSALTDIRTLDLSLERQLRSVRQELQELKYDMLSNRVAVLTASAVGGGGAAAVGSPAAAPPPPYVVAPLSPLPPASTGG